MSEPIEVRSDTEASTRIVIHHVSMSEEILAEKAAALHESVGENPRQVVTTVAELLDSGQLPDPIRVDLLAARGRAEHELGDVPSAIATLTAAAELARGLGLSDREGHIRGSLALSAYSHGDAARAHTEVARAEALLDGADRARMTMQRAIISVHEGDLIGGLQSFNDALPALADAGDDLAVARLLVSRGVAQALLGDADKAEDDYRAGADHADRLGQKALAASARANLAHSIGRRGDVPGSLRWFDRARRDFDEVGNPDRYLTGLESDVCEVLLDAGLHDEARVAAERAVDLATAGENRVQQAEAQLLLSKALMASGATEAAADEAERAAASFRETGRTGWTALADFAAVLARPSADHRSYADQLASAIDGLDSAGWRAEAMQARSMRVVALVGSGDVAGARAALDDLAHVREVGPGLHRSRAWYATALVRRAEGHISGARRAVAVGVRLVDEHRALLGATELRMLASEHRRALVELGLELALERRRLDEVFRYAETAREGALSFPAALPPEDEQLATSIAEYRRATARKNDALGAGDPDAELDRAVAAAERSVREATRRVDGSRSRNAPLFTTAEIRERLDGRSLLQFHESGGRIGAVVIGPGRSRRLDLVAAADVRSRVTSLYFSLRRLTSEFGSAAAREATAAAAEADARWLQETLIDPARVEGRGRRAGSDVAGHAGMVIVPSESLVDIPWSVCSIAARVPISVAPSVSMWGGSAGPVERWPSTDAAATGRVTAGEATTVAVAGPGLDAAVRELEHIRRSGRLVSILAGDEATVDAVTDAMTTADIAHIAAHGTFRSDSPLFSSLALADGDLTVYDIERLAIAPRCVVLAACHAARGGVGRGGEIMGTAAALVRAGTASVIAPLVAVADEASADLMATLHDSLAERATPVEALRDMIAAAGPSGLRAWTARSYVCTGADDRVSWGR